MTKRITPKSDVAIIHRSNGNIINENTSHEMYVDFDDLQRNISKLEQPKVKPMQKEEIPPPIHKQKSYNKFNLKEKKERLKQIMSIKLNEYKIYLKKWIETYITY